MRLNNFTSPAGVLPGPARGVPATSPFAAGGVVAPPGTRRLFANQFFQQPAWFFTRIPAETRRAGRPIL